MINVIWYIIPAIKINRKKMKRNIIAVLLIALATMQIIDAKPISESQENSNIADPIMIQLEQMHNEMESATCDDNDYTKSITIGTKALQIIHNENLDKTGIAANIHNTLSQSYYHNDEYEKAKTHNLIAFKIYKSLYGATSIEVANMINGLGNIADVEVKYPEAIRLYKQALAIYKKNNDNANVSILYTNIGDVYYAQSNFKQAEDCYKTALSINQKLYKEDDIETIEIIISLGEAYLASENYKQAEQLLIKAKTMLESKTSKNNHELEQYALALQDLGVLRYDQDKYSEAIALYETSISIREKMPSFNTSAISTTLNNIAMAYQNQSLFKEAEKAHKKSIALAEKVLNPNDPDLATSYWNLGLLYDEMNQNQDAIVEFEKALHIYENTFGLNHVDTQKTLQVLIDRYYALDMNDKAEMLEKKLRK